jgi:hypothetical protein
MKAAVGDRLVVLSVIWMSMRGWGSSRFAGWMALLPSGAMGGRGQTVLVFPGPDAHVEHMARGWRDRRPQARSDRPQCGVVSPMRAHQRSGHGAPSCGRREDVA